MLSLLSSLVKYVAGIIIVCQSLSLLGVNVGTIIASVGVLALVVGFSAESLIADVVIGAFMLLENQYNVGDIVEVNGFRGVVTKIGILHHLHHRRRRQCEDHQQLGDEEYPQPFR